MIVLVGIRGIPSEFCLLYCCICATSDMHQKKKERIKFSSSDDLIPGLNSYGFSFYARGC